MPVTSDNVVMRIRRQQNGPQGLTAVKDRLDLLQALHDALLRWPEVSALGFASNSTDDFLSGLQELMGINDTQARAVSDMQVRRLPSLERKKIADELAQLKQEFGAAD